MSRSVFSIFRRIGLISLMTVAFGAVSVAATPDATAADKKPASTKKAKSKSKVRKASTQAAASDDGATTKVRKVVTVKGKRRVILVERGARPARVRELLQQVGLPTGYTSLYPSRLSGGERQRVAIARALALRPDLLVLDEPVSALDVSIQAQVISVLMKLHREQGLAYLFISHDLALVRLVADRVAVMYLGKFMEIAATDELFANPTHPYTQALLGASPSLGDLHAVDLQAFSAADTVSPLILPSGCRFRTRCWKAQERCAVEEPALIVRELAGASHAVADHLSACHFPEVSLPAWLSPADPADGEGTVAQPNAVSVATPARSGRAPDPEDANTA